MPPLIGPKDNWSLLAVITTAAMAAARRWPTLIVPAILCGVLGYATANFIGMAVAHMLH